MMFSHLSNQVRHYLVRPRYHRMTGRWKGVCSQISRYIMGRGTTTDWIVSDPFCTAHWGRWSLHRQLNVEPEFGTWSYSFRSCSSWNRHSSQNQLSRCTLHWYSDNLLLCNQPNCRQLSHHYRIQPRSHPRPNWAHACLAIHLKSPLYSILLWNLCSCPDKQRDSSHILGGRHHRSNWWQHGSSYRSLGYRFCCWKVFRRTPWFSANSWILPDLCPGSWSSCLKFHFTFRPRTMILPRRKSHIYSYHLLSPFWYSSQALCRQDRLLLCSRSLGSTRIYEVWIRCRRIRQLQLKQVPPAQLK